MVTFVGQCPSGATIGHLDGDRANNKLENLKYMSPSCNEAFKIDDGTLLMGEDHSLSKLTNKQVRLIRVLSKYGFKHKDIGSIFNISSNHAGRIVRLQSWKHII